MEWVETTGRTLEEAKEAALDQLGVDEVDAEFDVLEEPRAGLFGRVRGEARVRARVRPTAPRPKEDRRDRRRRRGAGEAAQAGSPGQVVVADEDGGDGSEDADLGGGRRGDSRRQAQGRGGGSNGEIEGEAGADGEGAGVGEGGAKRRRRRRGTGRSSATSTSASANGPSASDTPAARDLARSGASSGGTRGRAGSRGGNGPGEPSEGHSHNGRGDMSVEVPLDEQARVAEEFLRGLISQFGMEASVRVTTSSDEEVKLDLSGSELGLLIGPKGSTLLALQDLTRTAVHHKTQAGNGRIFVDVGAYRQKRSEALARFAQQVADKVKETGSATALEPMAAPDRKVVHDAVTGIEGVSTVSEGEEPRRRVVIVPSVPADA